MQKNIYLNDEGTLHSHPHPTTPQRASVYFMTLCKGCKKLSHDFLWLAQMPFELLHSLRARTAEGQRAVLH